MKLRDFNTKYSMACDKIYKTVGNKEQYKKKDAVKMSKKAMAIIAAEFSIDKDEVKANELQITELLNEYSSTLVKVQGFDGILLACAFAVLEGTGKEKVGFGKWLMFRSVFMGGIKSSVHQEIRPNKSMHRSP